MFSKPSPWSSIVSSPTCTISSTPSPVEIPKAWPPGNSLTRSPVTGATATCPDGSMATPSPAIFCANTSSGTDSRSTTVPSSGARISIFAISLTPCLLALLYTIVIHAAIFHETIDATGNTVRLRYHHNLDDLAPLDHTRGAKTLETRLVDLNGIIDKEAQPCDTALHALYIRLATKRREHLASQHVVAILFHRAFRRSRLPRRPRTPRDLRASLAFGQ